jgi:hypothetical protein
VELRGGKQEAGTVGKKGRSRYQAQYFQDGDRVRIAGRSREPRGADPADTLVLGPGNKGRLVILVR